MAFNFSQFVAKSQKALEHVKHEIAMLRTGRASVDMLDSVMVEAYGTHMKLVEVASVSAPDPTLLTISPWDKGLLEAVAKGVSNAGLELNPVVDGQMIRIGIASLTQERRQEMVKILQRRLEDGKVLLRTIRSEIKKEIEEQEGTAAVSEDDIALDLEKLEKQHKEFMDMAEQIGKAKEKELLTF
ncbi:ribosome recycling factor [Candidatus Woesebacteria bacterium]|nr:ribosome recycling factor [Candidatus Woesebacteria bacterium]